MKFRFFAICMLALVPFAAIADDVSVSQAQAPQNAVGASNLIPQSGSSDGGVSSTGAASSLQPNASSLQGSSTDGSNLSAPSGQNLQSAPASEGLKVILGADADGSPQSLSDTTSSLGEDLIGFALGVLIVCSVILFLRRNVMRPLPAISSFDPTPATEAPIEPVVAIEEPIATQSKKLKRKTKKKH